MVRGWVSHRSSQPSREIRCACLPIGQRCAAPCTLFRSLFCTRELDLAKDISPAREPRRKTWTSAGKSGARAQYMLTKASELQGKFVGYQRGGPFTLRLQGTI